MKGYGKELILDLHNCDPSTFTRLSIREYLKEICERIEMERCKLCWWDDLHTPIEEKETEPHLVGTSVVQFIKTSNITIHTLDVLKKVYINIFSCKDFNVDTVIDFSEGWFEGKIINKKTIWRK